MIAQVSPRKREAEQIATPEDSVAPVLSSKGGKEIILFYTLAVNGAEPHPIT